MKRRPSNFGILTGAALWLGVQAASACPACLGKVDSAMIDGYNWGILSLVFVITSVLASIAGFFVYLARRAARLNAQPLVQQFPKTSTNV